MIVGSNDLSLFWSLWVVQFLTVSQKSVCMVERRCPAKVSAEIGNPQVRLKVTPLPTPTRMRNPIQQRYVLRTPTLFVFALLSQSASH